MSEPNGTKEIYHFQKWIVITATVLLVLFGWQWIYMMPDAFSKILYMLIALGLIVPMALFAVKIDENGIYSIWEFRGKTLRVINSVPWSDVVRVDVTEKFFYKGLKNIYVIPHTERKALWRGYASAVSFNAMMENCREIGQIIVSKVPEEVDKSALEEFMKSLEPKAKE